MSSQINNVISAIHQRSTHQKYSTEYHLSSTFAVKTTDRLVNSFPPPRADVPTKAELLDPRTLFPRLEVLREHFREEGRIEPLHAMMIIDGASKLFKEDSKRALRLPTPNQKGYSVNVIGSVYGQFRDLLNIFDKFGDPSRSAYVFLGNYVNGGAFSVECYLYLCALKIHFPSNIIMLKGSEEYTHGERRKQNDKHLKFTFESECERKYDKSLFSLCVRSFAQLPLYAVLFGKILCVHSGISPEFKTLDKVAKNERGEVDILFSRFESGSNPFVYSPPECSKRYTKTFSSEDADTFLARCGLSVLVRSHEMPVDGLDVVKTPCGNTVFTVFSAPSFGDTKNHGSGIVFQPNGKLMQKTLKSIPDPYVAPNSMNAFELSLPIASNHLKNFVEQFVTGLGNLSSPLDFAFPELSLEEQISIEKHASVIERSQLKDSVLRACALLSTLNRSPNTHRRPQDNETRPEKRNSRDFHPVPIIVDQSPSQASSTTESQANLLAFPLETPEFDFDSFLSSPYPEDPLDTTSQASSTLPGPESPNFDEYLQNL
ncbi:unnamed protein product [Kuraishia capsulata CBS 1993]|uniref:Serine/threonine specific protein phosphatases domain-containing protein n=1 Tax=Kuraishia capsulata CBS 1993 TaxID=1382522 RepID=W6MFS5_9ASCO|nr:uncharacterized protein KUCA_T00000198001 [Kuraishia capsulata CBS 1993]CDK24238.1 unnamed protein product [Kuraishia capsulata CBS 1993]